MASQTRSDLASLITGVNDGQVGDLSTIVQGIINNLPMTIAADGRVTVLSATAPVAAPSTNSIIISNITLPAPTIVSQS